MDSIAVEDWVANREVFGPTQDGELEAAYQVETGQEHPELLLVKAEGKTLNVELTHLGKKTEKFKINSGDFMTIVPDEGGTKVKVLGKNNVTLDGSGKKKIIIEAV